MKRSASKQVLGLFLLKSGVFREPESMKRSSTVLCSLDLYFDIGHESEIEHENECMRMSESSFQKKRE